MDLKEDVRERTALNRLRVLFSGGFL